MIHGLRPKLTSRPWPTRRDCTQNRRWTARPHFWQASQLIPKPMDTMDLLADCARMAPIHTVGHPLQGGKSVMPQGGVQASIPRDDTLLIPGTNSAGDCWSFNLKTNSAPGKDIEWKARHNPAQYFPIMQAGIAAETPRSHVPQPTSRNPRLATRAPHTPHWHTGAPLPFHLGKKTQIPPRAPNPDL